MLTYVIWKSDLPNTNVGEFSLNLKKNFKNQIKVSDFRIVSSESCTINNFYVDSISRSAAGILETVNNKYN